MGKLCWESGGDLQGMAVFCGGVDLTVVGSDDGFGNGKTNAVSAGLGIAGWVCPVKPVKQ